MRLLFGLVALLPLVGAELELDVISYHNLVAQDAATIQCLRTALLEKGIVGVSDIPGYKEVVEQFIQRSREFSLLPEEEKMQCAPDRDIGDWMGYENGKEKFLRDGQWVVEDKKRSYYSHVPDTEKNRWPTRVDLKGPYQAMGLCMRNIATKIMESVDLIGDKTGISIEGVPAVGRMLHYEKSFDTSKVNPYWCGAHFDHSMFTALIPSVYFVNGEEIDEPEEAGLFVRTGEKEFLKVRSRKDIMMFQVGEFAQLVTNDAIRATEHRVHKADGVIERYTMALFLHPSDDTMIYSQSVLVQDPRYGTESGCAYGDWCTRTIDRFRNK